MKTLKTALLFIFISLLSSAALAVDGLLEINQTCAVQLGCFSGDTPGFPVTINGSAGHSYILTSDLVLPDVNSTGIIVNTPDTSIDLNGFSIVGLACLNAREDCTPTNGTGTGVIAFFLPGVSAGVSVKNGSITGMGRNGLFLGAQAEVRSVRVRWNRWNGIAVGDIALLDGNLAFENEIAGIFTGIGSTIRNNTSGRNGGNGMTAGFGSTITDNTIDLNNGHGISTGGASKISGNTSYANLGIGILAGQDSIVRSNMTNLNVGSGISAASGSLVQGNVANSNSGYGLSLATGAAYRDNVVRSNAAGTVLSGFNMGGNFCQTNATCP